MEVSDTERLELLRWFEEHMGPDRAATMMTLVPPVDWPQLATKGDLAELEARIEARIDARIAELRADLQRTFGTWLFASQAAVIAVLGVLIALS